MTGRGGEIRTLGTSVSGPADYKSAAISLYATPPMVLSRFVPFSLS